MGTMKIDDLPTLSDATHAQMATTGVIVVDHGSRRAASNAMLEKFVSTFAEATGWSIVEPAHMELAEPSIATAFERCVKRGATRVMVCPYFLLPGKHWDEDIPTLTQAAAAKHPDVPYVVTAPIGLHPMMQQVIRSRLEYCLSHLAGEVPECESCKGMGRCQMRLADGDQVG